MSDINPFQIFFNWLFDGEKNSELSDINVYKVISHYYVLTLFMTHPILCSYLNKTFNNYNIVLL